MDFSWSETLEQRREDLLRFASECLSTDIADNDPDCSFSEENWQRCAEQGVLGYLPP